MDRRPLLPRCRGRRRRGLPVALLALLLPAVLSEGGSGRRTLRAVARAAGAQDGGAQDGGAQSAIARSAVAQAAPVHFRLTETWPDRAPRFAVRELGWPAGHRAGGLAVSADGRRLAVLDATTDQLRVTAPAGGTTVVLGASGTGPGALNRAQDVAFLPDGRLALSDAGDGTGRVQLWAADGQFERQWAVADPRGIVWVDEARSAGLYVVSETADGGGEVLGFSADGRQTERFPISVDLGGELPRRVRPRVANLAFVKTEPINDGGTLRPVPGFLLAAPVEGLALMLQGPLASTQLMLLDRSDPPRLALPGLRGVASWQDPMTGRRYSFAAAPVGGGSGGIVALAGVLPEQMDRVAVSDATDLDVGPDGTVFVSSESLGPLSLGLAQDLAPRLLGLGRMVGPRRVAAARELLLADGWPRVQRWGVDGQARASLPVALPGGGMATALDVAAGARAWSLAADAILREVQPDGLTGFWQAPARPWSSPVAVAAEPGGGGGGDGVAVLDLAQQAILLLDRNLRETGRIALARPDAPFRRLTDLVVASDALAVADAENGWVEVYERDGRLRTRVTVPGGVERLSAGPDGGFITLGPSGWAQAFAPDGAPRGAWRMDAAGAPRDLALGEDGLLYAAGPDDALRVYARDDAAASGEAPPAEAPGCRIEGDKRAEPSAIALGQTVTVTLSVAGRCRRERRAADVLLLIDSSGSMGEGRKYVAAKNAAISFIAGMGRGDNRVAVLDFNSVTTVRQRFTADRAAAAAAVGTIAIGGGTAIVTALDAAAGLLQAEAPEAGRADAARTLVMLSDGRSSDSGLDAVLQRLQALGVDVYTVGLGEDVDPAMLTRIASRPDLAFLSPGIDTLQALFDVIGRRILEPPLLDRRSLVDLLPANMLYLQGSGRPVEPDLSPDGRTLTWTADRLPAAGFTVSYGLRPMQPGEWPTNDGAWLDYVDGTAQAGRLVFPVPRVRVAAPAPRPIYLPLALTEACPDQARPNEIVLVIDASGSMDEADPSGGSKLQAALRAAGVFLNALSLGRDRAAVVAFNSGAQVLSGLTADRGRLDAALNAIATAPGTRLALGIQAGAELLSGARQGAGRSLILLTDGRATDPDPGASLAAATGAKAGGTEIFAIGLGADVDAAALQAIAGAADHYFAAPDSAALARIYARIAVALPCPKAPRSAPLNPPGASAGRSASDP